MTLNHDLEIAPALTQSERERLGRAFSDDGYCVVPNVVARGELARLNDRIVDEFERIRRVGALFSGGGTITGHLNCFPGAESKFVYDALEQRGIIALVKAIFPRELRSMTPRGNMNLPHSVTQHYHADSPFTRPFMIINIAVVDTNVANGAIDVIPGTHKKFYKYWRFAVERPDRARKRIPMSAGDVLIRTSTLWHRGMPNHTASARPMLAFTMRDELDPTGLADPFQFNGGQIMFYENWYRTNWLGQVRERAFVAAPFTYAAYRFVRSMFGDKGYATP